MSTIPDTPVRLKDGSTITIRTARSQDAPAVLKLVRPIFAEREFLLTTLDEFQMTEEQEAACRSSPPIPAPSPSIRLSAFGKKAARYATSSWRLASTWMCS